MEFVLGLVVFVVGLLFSVGWHELGHMLPAKKFGVRVSQYMIGFGPTLWSRTKGDTEYGVKAIPLGGYVRMAGMYRTTPVHPPKNPDSWPAKLAAEAREASAEEIPPGEDSRAFYHLTVPRKLVVMLGGPFMNLILATVLFAVVLCAIGIGSIPNTTVAQVSQCVLTDASATTDTCPEDATPAPAAAAGLLPGDRIVTWDGKNVTDWNQLTADIRATADRTVDVGIVRDGRAQTLTITPMSTTRALLDPEGNEIIGSDGKAVTGKVGFIGMTPGTDRERQPVTAVPAQMGTMIAQTVGVLVKLPATLWNTAEVVVSDGQRDPNGPMSIVGVARLAGEVGSVQGGGIDWTDRVASWLGIIASLNLALCVFNLIPLLPLDGGHVVGALWEGWRRRWAAWRGVPDPGPVDTARMMPLAYGVFGVLAIMTLVLVVADIVKPITLG